MPDLRFQDLRDRRILAGLQLLEQRFQPGVVARIGAGRQRWCGTGGEQDQQGGKQTLHKKSMGRRTRRAKGANTPLLLRRRYSAAWAGACGLWKAASNSASSAFAVATFASFTWP